MRGIPLIIPPNQKLFFQENGIEIGRFEINKNTTSQESKEFLKKNPYDDLSIISTSQQIKTDEKFVSYKFIEYKNIKNKMIKKEQLLLKIITTEEIIFKFENIHILELVSLALSYNCSENFSDKGTISNENTLKIINSDILESKKILGNLINDSQLFSSYKPLVVESKKVCSHMIIENKTSSLLELMLNKQILIDVFCEMKMSVNQFFNFLKSSKFLDIKNPINSLDRLILKNLKKEEMNYASRINIFSELSLQKSDNCVKERKIVNTELKFTPIYENCVDKPEIINNEFEFNNKYSLICEPELVIEKEKTIINVDKKFFKKVLEMSRVVYRNPELKKDALAFENEVVKNITKLYGNDSLKYFKRILPSFFIKK
ncbi:hypothetical protein DMUE_3876 [Dictyocoela muelleri]|nr:hypothetical protein DMUE_3876 [Dictyocoela muelleri]